MDEKVKKPNIFKRLHASKLGQVLFFVVSMVVIVGVYAYVSFQLRRHFEIVKDDFSWVFQVDSISENDGKLVLEGWAFHLEEDATEGSFEIVLRDIETEKRYYPEMQYHTREDVNEYFLCEYDYTKSGFTAEINLKKLDLENRDYEVLLLPSRKRKGFSTDIYYSDDEMMFVNPKEYVPLKTEGTDLEKVTEDGVLRVYRPDFGMYVYQYEGELYWIAEEDYEFIDGDSYVRFQMETTQVNNLPQHRLDNGWYWSNLSFGYRSKELTEWKTGQYRVAKTALPIEYSLTQIWTGNHSDGFPAGYVDAQNRTGWLWRTDFRPWYEFGEME